MKTQIIFSMILFAVLPALFTSCDKIGGSASVQVSYPLQPMTFVYTPTAPKSVAEELLLYQVQVNLNVDSLINKYLPGGVLGNTAFDTLWITIVPPDTANFAWLASARAEVASDSVFTSPLPIGNVTNTDSTVNAKTLVLHLDQTNIQPLLGTQGFWFRLYADTRSAIPFQWITMQINSGLTMTIEPSK